MVEIPQIKPKTEVRVAEKKETGSFGIPRIGLNTQAGDFKKKFKFKLPTFSLKGKNSKKLKIIGGIVLVLFSFILISGILFYRVYRRGLAVQASVENLVKAGTRQDLDKIKSELGNTKTSLGKFESAYKTIAWSKFIPYLGSFVKDGRHGINAAGYGLEAAEIVIEVIEPYADIIGFSSNGDQAANPDETTQDRLDFVIKTIPDIINKADPLTEKVALIQKEISQINPDRYPEKFADYEVRSLVQRGVDLVNLGSDLVINGKPLLEAAPYIIGKEEGRTYLVLFQNDKELRPTGGFLTAYSIATVEAGKFKPVSSSDIYNLDNSYFPTIPAPDPIVDYLKGPYLISENIRLRDLNWSPDFAQSMETFVEEAETVGISNIDGIIAVDTQLLVNILDAMGPIGVPGFGNFSTEIIGECNCPQVIYELESFADIEGPIVWSENEPGKIVFAPPNYDNRKKIIGPLMNSILSNALGQSKEKIPALFEAAFKSLTEKHVLFYLLDDDAQKAVVDFGIGGTIDEFNGDYLHINDANLGGRKSNLYVTQEVSQEISVSRDGSVEKTVTITYNNPAECDGWLNSVLPNWVRIYVPEGSELIDTQGLEDSPEPYTELGKTVFAGYFELRPQGVAKISVTYKLPFKVDKEYNLFIQKQPGTDIPLHSIKLGKFNEELFLRTDKEFKIRI